MLFFLVHSVQGTVWITDKEKEREEFVVDMYVFSNVFKSKQFSITKVML